MFILNFFLTGAHCQTPKTAPVLKETSVFKAVQTPFLGIARVTVNFLCVFVGVSYPSVPSCWSSRPSDAPRPDALVFPFLLCICVGSQLCWELDLPVPTLWLHHRALVLGSG